VKVRTVKKNKTKKKKKEQAARPLLTLAGMPLVAHLVRSHWKALTLAFLAVLGETAADILEPWPVKVVIDNVLQHKALPHRFDAIVALLPKNDFATLNFAIAGVLLIAVIGAISSYSEKFLTTSVAQWVAHDLRRMVYQRIQRLSLAEHGKSRSGDLITRVTKDIDAVQDFLDTALLGIVVSILTLVGMVGVMLYVNWRFTLVGLSVAPVLFVVVYFYSRRIKDASRAVKKKESDLLSGIAEVFTRSQFERVIASQSRLGLLMQRAWNRDLSGDLLLVPNAYSSFGSGEGGATHGTPYDYDTQVPLVLMGRRWIRPGAPPEYAEVVDIAPTLAYLLRVRPPAAAEGRVLTEALRPAAFERVRNQH